MASPGLSPPRIPIDPVTSAVDHFTPGFTILNGTSGSTAHLALTFNFFPQANCSSNCSLGVGYISSPNGGANWTAPKILAKGINPNLAAIHNIRPDGWRLQHSVVFFGNKSACSVFYGAGASVGSTLNEPNPRHECGWPSPGFGRGQRLFSSANDKPVPHAHSDVPRRTKPHRDDMR